MDALDESSSPPNGVNGKRSGGRALLRLERLLKSVKLLPPLAVAEASIVRVVREAKWGNKGWKRERIKTKEKNVDWLVVGDVGDVVPVEGFKWEAD